MNALVAATLANCYLYLTSTTIQKIPLLFRLDLTRVHLKQASVVWATIVTCNCNSENKCFTFWLIAVTTISCSSSILATFIAFALWLCSVINPRIIFLADISVETFLFHVNQKHKMSHNLSTHLYKNQCKVISIQEIPLILNLE